MLALPSFKGVARSAPGRCHRAQAPPRATVVARRAARDTDEAPLPNPQFNVHGRHVDVTDDVKTFVIDRLQHTLDKFKGGYLESEGGLSEVDVRLMNSQAEVVLRARHLNKHAGDSFLRQGELKVLGFGGSMKASLEAAAEELDKKLTRWSKASPLKKDYRSFKRT